MKELLDKRSFTQKHYLVSPNSYKMEAHIRHIHYRDGALKNGNFQPCDTSLEYNSVSKLWSMTKASYETAVGLYGDITFINVNHSIQFILDNPSKIEGVPYGLEPSRYSWYQGQSMIWRDILGTGGHQIVEVKNGELSKLFRFESKPSTNTITFQVVFTGNVKLFLGSTEIKPLLQEVRTTGVLSVECLGRLSWVKKPTAWNHRGERTDVELRWYKSGNKLFIDKIIPQTFIDNTFTEQGAWLECDITLSYYVGSGDGEVYVASANTNPWATVRGLTTGTAGASGYINGRLNGSTYEIDRTFLPINTSGIPDSSVITAANLRICRVSVSATTGKCALVQSNQPDPTNLVDGDFDSFVSLDSPAEGAARKNMTDFTVAYSDWNLNSTGLSWINKTGWTLLAMREAEHDVDNVAPTAADALIIRMAGSGGTAPYLDVTYDILPIMADLRGTYTINNYRMI